MPPVPRAGCSADGLTGPGIRAGWLASTVQALLHHPEGEGQAPRRVGTARPIARPVPAVAGPRPPWRRRWPGWPGRGESSRPPPSGEVLGERRAFEPIRRPVAPRGSLRCFLQGQPVRRDAQAHDLPTDRSKSSRCSRSAHAAKGRRACRARTPRWERCGMGWPRAMPSTHAGISASPSACSSSTRSGPSPPRLPRASPQ